MNVLDLRSLRSAAGLSQAEIARRLLLARSTISRYESLQRFIEDDVLDEYVGVCISQARRNWRVVQNVSGECR